MLVFKKDTVAKLFNNGCGCLALFRFRPPGRRYPNLVSALQAMCRFAAAPVDPYLARADDPVDDGSRDTFQAGRQKVVQPLAVTVFIDVNELDSFGIVFSRHFHPTH